MPEEEIIIEGEKEEAAGNNKEVGEENAGEGAKEGGDVEALAKEMGWRPKEDFAGDETDFVNAKTYIRKGQDIQDSMRKSLKSQKQQLSDMTDSIAELKAHNERVYKAEVANLKKELISLKTQKKVAIEDGDVEKVNEIDEQIDAVKGSIKEPEPVKKTAKTQSQGESSTPEFDVWVKQNPWYITDDEMGQYADTIATENKGLSFKRIANMVDKKVKEAFPEKFSEQKNVNVNRVEGSARRGSSSGKLTEADLTSSQKSIMNQFVRQGIMTKNQYIEDIAKVAGGAA